MKKHISLSLLITSVICLSGCSCLDLLKNILDSGDPYLTLNVTKKTISTGEKFQLEVTAHPSFLTSKEYIWYSSNESIATVSSTGLVTGIKGGNATITVEDSTDSKLNAKCEFTINAGITNLTLSNVKKNYVFGESFVKPTVTANYDDGTSKEVQNSCSFQGFDMNTKGKYDVTVVYPNNGKTITTRYLIRVSDSGFPTLTNIQLNDQKTEFTQGDIFEFGGTVTASYSDGTTDNVTNLCTFKNYDMSVAGKQYPIVEYKEGSVTKTKSYEINVEEVVTDLAPTKMKYKYSDVTANSIYKNYDSAPSVGNPKFLIVPVWFTDSSNYIASSKKEIVRSDIQKAYLGSTTETGWQSVKTFYKEESHNKLNIDGLVTDWYECGESINKYAINSNSGQALTVALAKKASDDYFNSIGALSRSSFDTDSDGYLDGVILIYGGPNYLAMSPLDQEKENLWAYCYWATSVASKFNPQVCGYFWASYDFMYSNSDMVEKTGKTTNKGAGDTSNCKIDAHTYIHEMGHILGLDDYYDYSNSKYCPAGALTMQDYNVGGHDPYSALSLGWCDPYIPKRTSNIELRPFQSSGDLIILTPNWNAYDSPFDEYLILEYYTPTGLNYADSIHSYNGRENLPSGSGIRVWHVDARLAYITAMNSDLSPTRLTTNPSDKTKPVIVAAKNTYNGSQSSQLATQGGYTQYYAFNILQLIRKNTTVDYYPTEVITNADLFGAGSTFSMNTYKAQFYHSGKLNSNIDLGWTFRVNSLDANKASITVVRG